jgi:hypothetical protein
MGAPLLFRSETADWEFALRIPFLLALFPNEDAGEIFSGATFWGFDSYV